VAAVKAPGFGDRRKAMREDIAILTGGTAISEVGCAFLGLPSTAVFGSAGNCRIVLPADPQPRGSGARFGRNLLADPLGGISACALRRRASIGLKDCKS
jgi:hypothetical protein